MFAYGLMAFFFVGSSVSSAQQSKEWDVLIFSQHWPITVCAEWEESKQSNKCTLPRSHNLWTVHGIWPTRIGNEGPFFCNNSWHFKPDELNPILNDMELYWMNIEANTPLYSLWQHEWVKHGTCAAELPDLNTQMNYFKKGLDWIQQFGMANILAQSNIKPSQNGYSIQNIYDSIKQLLNKNPIIQCIIDKHSKLSFISEIRICFSKNLRLVDCDLIKDNFEGIQDTILTNCDLKKSVMYLDDVPETTWRRNERKPQHEYVKRLYKIYNLLQYLIWFTL